MCLNHRECTSVRDLISHLAAPNCMASAFVTKLCQAILDQDDGETCIVFVRKLATAPDSQLDAFYRDQAKRLTADVLPVAGELSDRDLDVIHQAVTAVVDVDYDPE
jgi:hypothetical protein